MSKPSSETSECVSNLDPKSPISRVRTSDLNSIGASAFDLRKHKIRNKICTYLRRTTYSFARNHQICAYQNFKTTRRSPVASTTSENYSESCWGAECVPNHNDHCIRHYNGRSVLACDREYAERAENKKPRRAHVQKLRI